MAKAPMTYNEAIARVSEYAENEGERQELIRLVDRARTLISPPESDQLPVILAALHHKYGIPQREIANLVNLNQANVSRRIQKAPHGAK